MPSQTLRCSDLAQPLMKKRPLQFKPQTGLEQEQEQQQQPEKKTPKFASNADQSDPSPSTVSTKDVGIFLLLPLFLSIQFGLAYYQGHTELRHIPGSVLGVTIALYTLTAWCFRDACVANDQDAFTLVPDVIINVCLVLIIAGKAVIAFVVLVTGLLGLALIVTASSLLQLLHGGPESYAVSNAIEAYRQLARKKRHSLLYTIDESDHELDEEDDEEDETEVADYDADDDEPLIVATKQYMSSQPLMATPYKLFYANV